MNKGATVCRGEKMSHFEDAKELIMYAKNKITDIKSSYEESLGKKDIQKQLQIEIKNFLENLRSALDYVAEGLFHKYGDSLKNHRNIYFPIAKEKTSLEDFRKRKGIENNIPGISNSNPSIVRKIESYQAFSDPKNVWLPKFRELCNNNKHQRLTPQVKRERKGLRISSNVGTMTMDPGTIATLAPGTVLKSGDLEIRGGQTFSPEKPPKIKGGGNVDVITWVSFEFSTNGEPVLQFLEVVLNGVEKIVEELSVNDAGNGGR